VEKVAGKPTKQQSCHCSFICLNLFRKFRSFSGGPSSGSESECPGKWHANDEVIDGDDGKSLSQLLPPQLAGKMVGNFPAARRSPTTFPLSI